MRRFPLQTFAALLALAAASLSLGGIAAPTGASAQEHRSFLRVGETAPGRARQIRLGLNKSMIIELPRDVREVMVSNPAQVDAVLQTARRAYLIGKNPGEANVLFTDKDGREVVVLEVTIERDLAALGGLINSLLSGSRVEIQTVGNSVVLTGTVTSPVDSSRACKIVSSYLAQSPQASSSASSSGSAPAMAISVGGPGGNTDEEQYCKGIINMLTVEGREQVLLKVSVVEMERNIVKQFGIDLNALINSGNFAFAAMSSFPFPLSGPRGIADLGVQWVSGSSQVSGVLRALEENGLLHTLAEPNLTAISGETANFLAGGEFPIPVNQSSGSGVNNSAITVEFKKFGIGLAFTPVVMSEGRISLKVSTEVSELTNEGAVILQNIAIPALKVRRAETVVELPSGGSLVMAGLLSDQSKQLINGYPVLKNLPVLGALFRSRDFIKKETELVVLVTPYVVNPAARSELAQPNDGFGWASDVKADLLGQMNRIYGRDPERAPVGQFNGDVGFIVE